MFDHLISDKLVQNYIYVLMKFKTPILKNVHLLFFNLSNLSFKSTAKNPASSLESNDLANK